MKTLKNIKTKQDPKTGQVYLDIKDFSSLVDTSKVSYYTLETVDDDGKMALILKFYDKNKKLIEPNKN